ncbi:hypothetical protein ES703_18317 [subsurface metagenome]
MKSNSNRQPLFSELVFLGLEVLPKDLIPNWGNIRGWAFKNNLIWEPELQLITSERIEELRKHFVYEDRLSIIIHLYKDSSGKLEYLEYPYLPIKTLIKRAIEVEIVYWQMIPIQMIPTTWNINSSIKNFGEVRFGFWYPDISSEEFQSRSNAKLVVKKFEDLFYQLSENYIKKKLSNGVLDIEVDGDVKAKFFKTGRLYDVEFTLI